MRFAINRVCAICQQIAIEKYLCLDCHNQILACMVPKNPKIFNCFVYQYPVSRLIKSFKYNADLLSAAVLAYYASDYFVSVFSNYKAVIPMPAHSNRIKQRGLHATDYLIRLVLQHSSCKINIINTYGWRIVNALPQQTFCFDKRKDNVLTKHFSIPEIDIRNCLVFDDVMTTGATWAAFHACFDEDLPLLTLART